MKYTANYVSENTISTYGHNRQVEIVVSATPIGHVKGYGVVTFFSDRVVVSRIDTIPFRFHVDDDYDRILNILHAYIWNKYGMELFVADDCIYNNNSDMCDAILGNYVDFI